DEDERRRVLVDWQTPGLPTRGAGGVHELIERQAARTPDACAVCCGARRVTYRELDRLAERIAGRLRAIGLRPEARVALYMDRSVELVAAMVAILKAGGAYIPL